MPRRVIVFDVNETLLDLSHLDTTFHEVFGDTRARQQWFTQLLKLAMTATIVEDYRDFSALARIALEQVATLYGLRLGDGQIERFARHMQQLPPHADAQPALARLRASGFRLAALTNSAPTVARAQLQHAGLADLFGAILSVDEARRFKPAPAPYRMAARHLQVKVSELRMVAVHDWDIIGAMAAGCRGAFVARDGIAFPSLVPQPDVCEPDLEALAEAIIRLDT